MTTTQLENASYWIDERRAETLRHACNLAVRGGDIVSVMVVPGCQPSDAEIKYLRDSIALMPVDLDCRPDGVIRFRPIPAPQSAPARTTAYQQLLASEQRTVAVLNHLFAHVAGWNAGFLGLSEGTR